MAEPEDRGTEAQGGAEPGSEHFRRLQAEVAARPPIAKLANDPLPTATRRGLERIAEDDPLRLVLDKEYQAILGRRKQPSQPPSGSDWPSDPGPPWQGPPPLGMPAPPTPPPRDPNAPTVPPDEKRELVGLALSGGGVRSAAFALGVVQAVTSNRLLKRIDYLSTVSGGGFTGSALTSTLTRSNGECLLASALSPVTPAPQEIADTKVVGRIRDYSNYLIPNGLPDVFRSATVVLRGIAANGLIVLTALFLLAAITVFFNPSALELDSLHIFGWRLPLGKPAHLLPSLVAAGVLFLAYAIWAINRSQISQRGAPERRVAPVWLLGATLAVFALDFQRLALQILFEHQGFGALTTWIQSILVPIAAAVTLFYDKLVPLLDRAKVAGSLSAIIGRIAGKAVVWVAALVLPLLLWLLYLDFCYWGMTGLSLHEPTLNRPAWLSWLAGWLAVAGRYDTAIVYGALGLFGLIGVSRLRGNANSLHQLYRDRIGKAFLFDPRSPDFPPDDTRKVSSLDPVYAPYHLINATVNLQGSHYLNKRGRDADFFIFSPLYTGSAATGYASMQQLERSEISLDLARAIAISGAAVSSNMGANSIRPLTFTLALLNARLGYWLTNPYKLTASPPPLHGWQRLKGWFNRQGWLYLGAEIFGLLSEKMDSIYLTDGGHIDNLGIYELLRRRCRVIILADAEADAGMTFGSFVRLQRYARIDLGIRISLPWQAIATTTRSHMGANAGTGDCRSGPHAALGTIDYGDGYKGCLLYLKSSLSGDENDYIRDYGRRYGAFPHETTGDQFFSEEQFEAYRALGFHIANGVFQGSDAVCLDDSISPLPNTPMESLRTSQRDLARLFRYVMGL